MFGIALLLLVFVTVVVALQFSGLVIELLVDIVYRESVGEPNTPTHNGE